jgi:hypothetical protein
MALLSRIYYNGVFGALGGLFAWLVYGVFGEPTPSGFGRVIETIFAGIIVGGIVGCFVVSVDAIRDLSLIRFVRQASLGIVIGLAGGAVGMLVGDFANYYIIGTMGRSMTGHMLARGFGWLFLGIAIGMSEGIAARSIGKLSYGTIGGALGGFIGGCLFGMFLYISIERDLGTTYLWSALGLAIMGACIGSLIALVRTMFQPANVKVLRGWQEGREYPLDKPEVLVGRDEYADIALFRDMKVEKKHAFIRRVGSKYVLYNNGAPPEQTLVNETPVSRSRDLKDGDRIQLGNIVLKFQARAAIIRAKRGRAVPAGS